VSWRFVCCMVSRHYTRTILFVSPADLPGRRRLRWSSSHQLLVPSFRLTTVGRRTLLVAASLLWNSLPSDIQSPPSLPVFRQRLKTFLFHTILPQHSSVTLLRLRGLRNSSAILATLKKFGLTLTKHLTCHSISSLVKLCIQQLNKHRPVCTRVPHGMNKLLPLNIIQMLKVKSAKIDLQNSNRFIPLKRKIRLKTRSNELTTVELLKL